VESQIQRNYNVIGCMKPKGPEQVSQHQLRSPMADGGEH